MDGPEQNDRLRGKPRQGPLSLAGYMPTPDPGDGLSIGNLVFEFHCGLSLPVDL